MESKNTFTVVLLEANNRATGKGTRIYEGDDGDAAKQAIDKEMHKPENVGKFVRFYDFRFHPGGGMKDFEIRNTK